MVGSFALMGYEPAAPAVVEFHGYDVDAYRRLDRSLALSAIRDGRRHDQDGDSPPTFSFLGNRAHNLSWCYWQIPTLILWLSKGSDICDECEFYR